MTQKESYSKETTSMPSLGKHSRGGRTHGAENRRRVCASQSEGAVLGYGSWNGESGGCGSKEGLPSRGCGLQYASCGATGKKPGCLSVVEPSRRARHRGQLPSQTGCGGANGQYSALSLVRIGLLKECVSSQDVLVLKHISLYSLPSL